MPEANRVAAVVSGLLADLPFKAAVGTTSVPMVQMTNAVADKATQAESLEAYTAPQKLQRIQALTLASTEVSPDWAELLKGWTHVERARSAGVRVPLRRPAPTTRRSVNARPNRGVTDPYEPVGLCSVRPLTIQNFGNCDNIGTLRIVRTAQESIVAVSPTLPTSQSQSRAFFDFETIDVPEMPGAVDRASYSVALEMFNILFPFAVATVGPTGLSLSGVPFAPGTLGMNTATRGVFSCYSIGCNQLQVLLFLFEDALTRLYDEPPSNRTGFRVARASTGSTSTSSHRAAL